MSKLTNEQIIDAWDRHIVPVFEKNGINPIVFARAIEEIALQESAKRIEELEADVQHWKANHDHMVNKCAFLSQRPDLPVDRIPAYEAAQRRIAEQSEIIKGLTENVKHLRSKLEALQSQAPSLQTMDDKYGDGSGHDRCVKCGLCKDCGDCKEHGCKGSGVQLPAQVAQSHNAEYMAQFGDDTALMSKSSHLAAQVQEHKSMPPEATTAMIDAVWNSLPKRGERADHPHDMDRQDYSRLDEDDIFQAAYKAMYDVVLPQPALAAQVREVWEVSSKTFSMLFGTEEAAMTFVGSNPGSVAGGMSMCRRDVLQSQSAPEINKNALLARDSYFVRVRNVALEEAIKALANYHRSDKDFIELRKHVVSQCIEAIRKLQSQSSEVEK